MSAMTPRQVREAHLKQCLDDIFEYCREHDGTCEGCIFFRKVSVFGLNLGICRVMDATDTFGWRDQGESGHETPQ